MGPDSAARRARVGRRRHGSRRHPAGRRLRASSSRSRWAPSAKGQAGPRTLRVDLGDDVPLHEHHHGLRGDRRRRGDRVHDRRRRALGVLKNLAGLVGTLYIALALFIVGVLLPVALFFGVPIRRFLAAVREPALIAFTTSTSEAALPRAMETMEAMGCPRRIVAFVLPLGYTLQPRWDDALPLARGDVRGAGGRRVAHHRPADHDDADADAHEQGRRRRAARVARHPGGHTRELSVAARRA